MCALHMLMIFSVLVQASKKKQTDMCTMHEVDGDNGDNGDDIHTGNKYMIIALVGSMALGRMIIRK